MCVCECLVFSRAVVTTFAAFIIVFYCAHVVLHVDWVTAHAFGVELKCFAHYQSVCMSQCVCLQVF